MAFQYSEFPPHDTTEPGAASLVTKEKEVRKDMNKAFLNWRDRIVSAEACRRDIFVATRRLLKACCCVLVRERNGTPLS